jgi:ABC-type lipoprotein export system ATPase subunit
MTDTAVGDPVLEVMGLEHRLYDPESGDEFVVLVERPLRIDRGSLVALVGPSGCGKTTLLTILGLLRAPSRPERLEYFRIHTRSEKGEITTTDLKETWRKGRQRVVERLRRRHVGFALQSGELLPALTVRENISVPLWLNGVTGEACRLRLEELLDAFRLQRGGPGGESALAGARVNKLSGGEYQRVALARAIAHRPSLVFVDEPTAALNRELAWEALEQLRRVQAGIQAHGATVMITHDEELALAFADVIVRMAPVRGRPAGEVVEVTANEPSIEEFDLYLDWRPDTGS